MKQFDVTVAGLVILDVLGFPILKIPPAGMVDFIEQMRFTVAGPAGGTAIDCGKLGLRTALVGTVGDDDAGVMIKQLLARYGVESRFVGVARSQSTSTSMVLVNREGQRPALHARGASDCLTRKDFPSAAYDATVFHMGGTGLLRNLDGEPTQQILQLARRHGCITTFDLVGARHDMTHDVLITLPFVDYFMPSIEEARILSGRKDVHDVVQFFLDQGVSTCVFTLGDQGVLIRNASQTLYFPAYEVSVVDTTGCGDAFSAGFILGLAKGFDWELTARFASACAALVATGLGSDAGIRNFDQVWEIMHTWPLKAGAGNEF